MKSGERETTFWEALRQYPPWYVRLMAKAGRAAVMSEVDIAIASGIEINRLREIIGGNDYEGVTLGEMRHFFAACKFDPTATRDRNRARNYDFICKTRGALPFRYLRKSPKWESEILPILKRLKERWEKQSSAA